MTHFRSLTFFGVFLLVSLSGQSFGDSHKEYDEPPVRKASEILPDYMIKGENFTVRDDVTWNDGLHEFTVDTEFGSFDVWGEPMLRVRLAEVNAWVALEKTSSAKMGAKSVGKSTVRKVGSLANAFVHPVKTVTGLPTGIGRLFRKAEHTAESVGDTVTPDENDDEDEKGEQGKEATDDQETDEDHESSLSNLGNKLIGVNAAYRRLAKEYGVNPYTTNTAIQEELLRLAKVEAYVSKSSSLLLPGVGTVLSVTARVTTSIYEESWLEIVARNEEGLLAMGASPEQIRELFDNDAINLTLLTLMIETLNDLPDADGRLNAVDQMIALETDSEAVFYGECLLMINWYQENQAPIKEILSGTLIPVVLTWDEKVIVFSASDYSYWTPANQALITDFSHLYEPYSSDREAWLADQASPLFRKHAEALGWRVKSELRATVWPEIPWALQEDSNQGEPSSH